MSAEFEDSSDSDIFVIKQTGPINKLSEKQSLELKLNVVNSVKSKKCRNKKNKVRKRSSDSEERKSYKKIASSTSGGQNLKKKLSKSRNKSDNSIKNKSSVSKNLKNVQSFKEKKNQSFSQLYKSPETSILKYFNSPELLSSSESSQSINTDNVELSPGISRKRKNFLITNSSPLKSKKKVSKPLMKMFDMLDEENFQKKETNHKRSLEVIKNVMVKDEIEFTEPSDATQSSTTEVEINVEEFLSQEDFQNNFVGMNTFENMNEEKFRGNSELLCCILKRIIRDVTKTQAELTDISFKKGKMIEKLCTESECEILEKFFHLEENACKLFVRMLGRKKSWHRVCSISYLDIGSNLISEFETLSKESYIDVNIEDEEVTTQMNLLNKAEVLKLCKAFNVFLKNNSAMKKEDLIKAVIKETQSQKSAMEMFRKTNPVNRFDMLKSKVKNTLGMCVRLNNRTFQIFYKILLLFSYAHYSGEEEKRFSTEMFRCYQVYNNMIRYPKYKFCPTVVFETRTDFDEYKKALLLLDCFEIAILNKNYGEFVDLFLKAKEEFKKLLQNVDYLNHFENMPPFLKKFCAGTVYARILTKYCTTFKNKTDKAEVLKTVQLLVNQNSFLLRKKGQWYEILSKILEKQKQNEAAAKTIITSLKDPLINEVQKLTLQLRGQFILKKRNNGINDVKLKQTLYDVCTLTVQEPSSIEIEGKAMDGNIKGFKSVYIQEFQNGKNYMSVEEIAILHYKSVGFTKGYHTEGFIVQSIYFLLFFDIIYGLSPEGVFQSPYQEVPLDFYSLSFYHNRKEEIDLLLSDMQKWDNKEVEARIRDSYNKNCNTICVIKWSDGLTPDLFCEVIKCITVPILVLIFERFVKNFREVQAGFPDLTLWNPETNKCKFVEVKSPLDRLSPAQRVWLDFLRKIGLDCEVCNLKNSNKRTE